VWRGLGIGLMVAGLLQLGGCARGTVQDALGMSKRAPDEFAVVRRAPLIVPPDYDLRPPDPGAPRPNIGTTSDQARVAMTGNPAEPSAAAQVLAGATPPATGQAVAGSAIGGMPASAIADDLLSAGTNIPNSGATRPVASAPAAPANTPAAAPANAPAGRTGETRGEMAMVALAGGNQADPDIRRTIAEENQDLADVEASLFTRIVEWRQPSTMGTTIDAPAEAQRLRDNKIAGRAPTDGDTPTVLNRRQSALQGLLEGLF
jgi:Protein of unknown function (DUF3035)